MMKVHLSPQDFDDAQPTVGTIIEKSLTFTPMRGPLKEYNHKTTPRLRATDRFDLLGREIQENDIIAYPTTAGRSAVMRVAQVVTIEQATEERYVYPKDGKGRYVKVPNPGAGFVMFVTYFEESMDWGLSHPNPEHDEAYHTQALCVGKFEAYWWREAVRAVHQGQRGRGGMVDYKRDDWGFTILDAAEQAAYDKAYAEWIAYHEKGIVKAVHEQAKPKKPKLYKLLFPGKAMIINNEWARHTRPVED